MRLQREAPNFYEKIPRVLLIKSYRGCNNKDLGSLCPAIDDISRSLEKTVFTT